jgi:hypothetical protein
MPVSAFTPIPPGRQPAWLRQLRQIVRVYPPDGETGLGAALCRWCDLAWPLPLARLEADPHERATWVLGVAQHGMQHAVDGDLRLDGQGEPLDGGGALSEEEEPG